MSRAKGFRLPLNTVVVARPSKWGNPYRIDDLQASWGRVADPVDRARLCVEHYRSMVMEGFVTVPYTILEPHERADGSRSVGAHRVTEVAAKYLRGKNLACWCPLDRPCHADVLLELANVRQR
jgi:hypothetical protein